MLNDQYVEQIVFKNVLQNVHYAGAFVQGVSADVPSERLPKENASGDSD